MAQREHCRNDICGMPIICKALSSGLCTVLSLNPYHQRQESGSRVTPLTEGKTEGQRFRVLPEVFQPLYRLLPTAERISRVSMFLGLSLCVFLLLCVFLSSLTQEILNQVCLDRSCLREWPAPRDVTKEQLVGHNSSPADTRGQPPKLWTQTDLSLLYHLRDSRLVVYLLWASTFSTGMRG